MRTRARSGALVSIVFFVSRAAMADEAAARPGRFGTAGSVVLDDVLALRTAPTLSWTAGWFSYRTTTTRITNGPEATTTDVRFAPSLDVFVVDRFAIGGRAVVERTTDTVLDAHEGFSTREIAPRIGYAFALADGLSLFPRIYGAYTWSDRDDGGVQGVAGVGGLGGVGGVGGDTSSVGMLGLAGSTRGFRVGGDASLVFALGRYAAITAGPTFAYAVSREAPVAGAPSRTLTRSFAVDFAGSLRLVL